MKQLCKRTCRFYYVNGVVSPLSKRAESSGANGHDRPVALARLVGIVGAVWMLLFGINPSAAGQGIEEAKDLFNRGVRAYRSGDMPNALEAWTKSLHAYKGIAGTDREQAICIQDIGKVRKQICRSEVEQSISKQEQSLRVLQARPGTEQQQAVCLEKIGLALDRIDRQEEAIAKYEQALKLYQARLRTTQEQASCHKNLSVALIHIGRYEEAMVRAERALKLFQTVPNANRNQAASCRIVGLALSRMRRFEKGIAELEHALKFYQSIRGADSEMAVCYMDIGSAFLQTGQHELAINKYEQAAKLFQTIPSSSCEQADCLKNIGIALDHMARNVEAMVKLKQALQIYETTENTEAKQLECYGHIGNVYLHSGLRFLAPNAVDAFLKAGPAWWASHGLGLAHYRRMEWSKAIDAFLRATVLAEEERASMLAAEARTEVFKETSKVFPDLVKALCLYSAISKSKATAQTPRTRRPSVSQRPDVTNRASTLNPEVVHWAENPHSKTALLEAAFHFADQGKGRMLEDALREKTILKGARTNTALLVEDQDLSQRISRLTVQREGLPAREVEQRKSLTIEIETLQQRRDIIEVELKRAAGYVANGFRNNIRLIGEYFQLGKKIDDLNVLLESVPSEEVERRREMSETIRMLRRRLDMTKEEIERTASGRYVEPKFRKPMEIAKELPSNTAVLQYSVGENGGCLLILTHDGVSTHGLGKIPALPEVGSGQQAPLERLTEAWNTRREKIGLEGLVRLARERAEDLGRDASERHNLLDAAQERAVQERLGEVILPQSVLTQLRQKGVNHLLVLPDGALHFVPFALVRVGEEGIADKKRYLIENFAISYAPAMTTLETIRRQKKEREAKRKVERRQLLAFANPAYGTEGVPTLPAKVATDDMVTRLRSIRTDYYKGGGLRLTSLPETEQEAMRVASLFAPPKQSADPATIDPAASALVLTSKAASEDQVKRLLSSQPPALSSQPGSPVTSHQSPFTRWKYLLFSTHGLADTYNGMLSCLALSSPASDSTEDGLLQAQEVLDLELDTDLVMLSACQTGLGRMRGGEGLVGLSASFFIAGAESVCATLWQVPSGPTTQLTAEFFRHLKEGKLDRAEALRQAQLTVMRSGQSPDGKSSDYSSPFCWAAFVLMGEYK